MCLPQPVPRGVQWCETENLKQETGQRTTAQRTWWEERALADRLICETAALVRVYEVLSGPQPNFLIPNAIKRPFRALHG